MDQPGLKKTGPGFYRMMAVVFFILAGIFIWAAVRQHSWFYGAFAAITVMNGLMSIVRSLAAAESKE